MRNAAVRFLISVALTIPAGSHGWTLRVDPAEAYLLPETGQPSRQINEFDRELPIHEEMTLATLDCDKSTPCSGPLVAQGIAAADVLAGVRWNDFPAVWFTKCTDKSCCGPQRAVNRRDVKCYVGAIWHADVIWREPRGGPRSRDSWFVRGHYGDLQAWHSMAPVDEPAEDTLGKMLLWARFWYQLSQDKWPPGTDMTRLGMPDMKRFFQPGARRVDDFVDFRTGKDRRGVALGAILHMVQDSYAPCHTERNARGEIARFNSYFNQSTHTHRSHDRNRDAVDRVMAMDPGPVVTGRRLLALRAAGADWAEVEPVLRDAWRLSASPAVAAAGTLCERYPAPGGEG